MGVTGEDINLGLIGTSGFARSGRRYIRLGLGAGIRALSSALRFEGIEEAVCIDIVLSSKDSDGEEFLS